jgi:hypothetical protein
MANVPVMEADAGTIKKKQQISTAATLKKVDLFCTSIPPALRLDWGVP